MLAAAWTAASVCSDVVARCADGVLDGTELTWVEHMGLTVALRDVLRAAEVARPLATGQGHERIDAAI